MPDMEDKFFFPKTIDGASNDPGFITGTKIGIIIAVIMVNFIVFSSLMNGFDSGLMITIKMAFMIFISQFIVRYLVLNERYYYNMYVKMKETADTTPATFWKIVDRTDKNNGCVVTFDDTSVGVYVKLERDSIVGKTADFKEEHYDAVSDFFRELNKNNFKYISMNIMETAGKDPRLPELDNLVNKAEFNENLEKLIGKQVAYIKSITRVTNYESEYILIYSDKMDMGDEIIDKVEDILYTLTNGAYSGYYILRSDEIDTLIKERYGVMMFDSSMATLSVYDKSRNMARPFKIKALVHSNGELEKYYTEEEKALMEKNKLKEQHKATKHKALKSHKDSNKSLEGSISKEKVKMKKDNMEEVGKGKVKEKVEVRKKEEMVKDGSTKTREKVESVASVGTIDKNSDSFEESFSDIFQLDEFEEFGDEYFIIDDEEEIEL